MLTTVSQVILYHVAPRSLRDVITAAGLYADTPRRWNLTRVEPAYGVYAWTTFEAARDWQSRDSLKHHDPVTDIWQITLPDDDLVYPDPMAEVDAAYSNSVVISDGGIAPDELTLMT